MTSNILIIWISVRHISSFIYDREKQGCHFMSTIHAQVEIYKDINKPFIIFYKKIAKGGVDIVDQKYVSYTTQIFQKISCFLFNNTQ